MNLKTAVTFSAALLAMQAAGYCEEPYAQDVQPAYGYYPYKSHYGPVYAANELNGLGGGGPHVHGLDYGFAARDMLGLRSSRRAHAASNVQGTLSYSGGYQAGACGGHYFVPGGCCNAHHYREVAPATFVPATTEQRGRSWYAGSAFQ
ncbi:MAG: hypothetical protein ACTHK7_08000 [Aureliella sp.]